MASEFLTTVAEAIREAVRAGKEKDDDDFWRDVALAAVQAMCYPSEAMIEAGEPDASYEADPEAMWQRMIKAALAE